MRDKKNKRITNYIYSVIVLAATILTFYYHFFDLFIFSTITLLSIGMMFLPRDFQKHSIQIYSFSLAIILGIYGFSTSTYKDYPFLNVLYSTARLFVFDTDQVFTADTLKFIKYPPAIEVARWSAVTYVSSTIFLLLMKAFDQSFKLFKIRFFGKHSVILGLNAKSATLAKDMLQHQKSVVIITENQDITLQEELIKAGAVIVHSDLNNDDTYRKTAIQKSNNIIAFHAQDGFNLDLIKSIDGYLTKNPPKKEVKIPIYIQQNHTLTQSLYDKITAENLEVHAISLHSLIARQLLTEHPIYEKYEERAKSEKGKPFHLLFVGFGHTGQQIAVEAIQRAHFYNSQLLHITVLDKFASQIEQEWTELLPRLKDAVNIRFLEHDVKTKDLVRYIQEVSTPVTHIYICLDNDEDDVLQALRLHQKFESLPIFIKLKRDGHFSDWLHNTEEFSYLKRFGSWDQVLTEEVVIRANLDKMAMKVHHKYMDNAKLKGWNPREWKDLSLFKKNSNRAQVDHLSTKLFLIGVEKGQEANLSQEEFKQVIESNIDKLAQVEHRRWNAFHFMNGWDTLPLEYITKDSAQDESRKLHACLVDWDQLKIVSDEQNKHLSKGDERKDYQQIDRDTINGIPDLFKEDDE